MQRVYRVFIVSVNRRIMEDILKKEGKMGKSEDKIYPDDS